METNRTVQKTQFAIKLAQGVKQRQAYKEVFGDDANELIDPKASRLANNEQVKEIKEAAEIDIKETLKEMAPEAINTIYSLMKDTDIAANTRLQAAKDIADRSGFGPTHKSETTQVKKYENIKLDKSQREEIERLLNGTKDEWE